MESVLFGVFSAVVGAAVGLLVAIYMEMRKWRDRAIKLQAFIENPNVQQVDKDKQYKESYEAMVNALSEERRQQMVAMTEAFDYLNDNGPFEANHNAGLMQVRNVLLRAIQISTYGRG